MDWRRFFASRTRLWAVAGLWGGILLIGLDVYAAVVTYIPDYRVRNDFRLMYGAAVTTFQHGYGHLYDLAAQKAAVEGLGSGFYWSPFLNPPPLVWLATPFATLPFTVAIVAWSILTLAACVLTWFLAAPGGRLTKAAYGAMWLGLFPVAYGLMVGQPVALVALAVAACWWLAQHERPGLAGLALSLIALKPQVALFVPLCLLVAGQARIFGGWLVATVFMALIALALLGQDGIARYREVLGVAAQWEITRRYAVAGPLGVGPQIYVAQAIALVATVAAAWRWRRAGPAVPMAAGIVGALLFTPYVGFQDFAMLVVAGWLVLRERPAPWQIGLLMVGYALLELALVVLAVPILLAEILLLASLIWPGPPAAPAAPRALPERAPA